MGTSQPCILEKKFLLYMKTKKHYFPTESRVTELDGGERSASWPQPLYNQSNSHWYPLNRRLGGPAVSLDVVWKIHKSVAPPRIPIPDHLALNLVTIVTTLSWLLTKMKK